MNDELAERLLAEIMGWNSARLTGERKDLEVLSSLKYDEYQQFHPGIRFMESLCLWLDQFDADPSERESMYQFIKEKLVFVSNAELNHIIRMTYPDVIKPYLVEQFIDENPCYARKYEIKKIVSSDEFKKFRRQCLFLGLSDGARIDILRRYSGLDHDQVYPTYTISNEKTKEFVEDLHGYLVKKGPVKGLHDTHYKIAFLIDDFSGSGASFMRKEGAESKGKIVRFLDHVKNVATRARQKGSGEGTPDSFELFDVNDLKICVILYIATTVALQQIRSLANKVLCGTTIEFSIRAVYELSNHIRLNDDVLGPTILKILMKYYDAKLTKNKSYRKGKIEKPYLGFDHGGLPLVLSHNCPNNSLPILWFDPDGYEHRGLFPRVERFPSD